jgi:hypothetical protein
MEDEMIDTQVSFYAIQFVTKCMYIGEIRCKRYLKR